MFGGFFKPRASENCDMFDDFDIDFNQQFQSPCYREMRLASNDDIIIVDPFQSPHNREMRQNGAWRLIWHLVSIPA